MAPPDKEKGNHHMAGDAVPNGDGTGGGSDGHGDDAGGRSHPCDGGGSGITSNVDQDHKACDEHTAGELSYNSVVLTWYLFGSDESFSRSYRLVLC